MQIMQLCQFIAQIEKCSRQFFSLEMPAKQSTTLAMLRATRPSMASALRTARLGAAKPGAAVLRPLLAVRLSERSPSEVAASAAVADNSSAISPQSQQPPRYYLASGTPPPPSSCQSSSNGAINFFHPDYAAWYWSRYYPSIAQWMTAAGGAAATSTSWNGMAMPVATTARSAQQHHHRAPDAAARRVVVTQTPSFWRVFFIGRSFWSMRVGLRLAIILFVLADLAEQSETVIELVSLLAIHDGLATVEVLKGVQEHLELVKEGLEKQQAALLRGGGHGESTSAESGSKGAGGIASPPVSSSKSKRPEGS